MNPFRVGDIVDARPYGATPAEEKATGWLVGCVVRAVETEDSCTKGWPCPRTGAA